MVFREHSENKLGDTICLAISFSCILNIIEYVFYPGDFDDDDEDDDCTLYLMYYVFITSHQKSGNIW